MIAVLVGTGLFAQAVADELTQNIQHDLVQLGYSPGNTAGEATTQTVVAIAKFEAEHGLTVSGQASPALAQKLVAEVANRKAGARQACLQEKIAEAEAKQRKRRGLGRLASAVGRVAARTGHYQVVDTLNDAHIAAMTVGDLTAAARDLGITGDEIAACDRS